MGENILYVRFASKLYKYEISRICLPLETESKLMFTRTGRRGEWGVTA